jgi:DNA-binding NarL/FixJ family response regulator
MQVSVAAKMEEGSDTHNRQSNLGIASTLQLTVKTVETHAEHILDKLGIEPSPEEHRRVLAVLELLRTGD